MLLLSFSATTSATTAATKSTSTMTTITTIITIPFSQPTSSTWLLSDNENHWIPLSVRWFWPLEFWLLTSAYSLGLTWNQRLSDMKDLINDSLLEPLSNTFLLTSLLTKSSSLNAVTLASTMINDQKMPLYFEAQKTLLISIKLLLFYFLPWDL